MSAVFRVGIVGVVVATVMSLLLVAPASAQTELQVSASVTGGPFLVGRDEAIPVTLTVTNTGPEERRVWGRVSSVEGLLFDVDTWTWRDLSPFGEGAVFAPGETRTYDLIGHVTEWVDEPRITIGVFRPTPSAPEIVETELTIPLVPGDLTDTIDGLVFADANENRTADPGEEMAGITVRLEQNFAPIRETISDTDGRFAFADVPVGIYALMYDPAPDGWILPYTTTARADGTGSATDLTIRARRPMAESLQASMTLDRKIYTAGSPVKLTVTLTNTGQYPLTGLQAGCDRLGTQFHLLVTQEAWGELAYGGPGATVQPGQTRTFRVEGTVPPRADYFGVVSAICDFGEDDVYFGAAAEAKPLYSKVRSNKTADTFGWVLYDKNDDHVVDEGEAVANTRIGLRDVTTGRMTTTAVTDAEGRIDYSDVPVGRYNVQVFGPWTPIYSVVEVAADPHTVPFGLLRVVPE